jgi:plasmid stabilization system protein ParE
MRDDLVELHDEAGLEYDDAFDWYLQRSEDAASDFDEEVNRAFVEISQSPRRWALGSHSCRRYLLQKFPYTVVYRGRLYGTVQVIAIAHASRKPGYWKHRL